MVQGEEKAEDPSMVEGIAELDAVKEVNIQSKVLTDSHSFAKQTQRTTGTSYDEAFKFGRYLGEKRREDWKKFNSLAKKLKILGAGGKLLNASNEAKDLGDAMISGHKENDNGGMIMNLAGKAVKTGIETSTAAVIISEGALAGTAVGGFPYGTAAGTIVGVGGAVGLNPIVEGAIDQVGRLEAVKVAKKFWGDELNKLSFLREPQKGKLNEEYLANQQGEIALANAELDKFLGESGDDTMTLDALEGALGISRGEESKKQELSNTQIGNDVVRAEPIPTDVFPPIGDNFPQKAAESAKKMGLDVGGMDISSTLEKQAQVAVGGPRGFNPENPGRAFSPELEREMKGITERLIPMFSKFPKPERAINAALAGIGSKHGLTVEEMQIALAYYQGKGTIGSGVEVPETEEVASKGLRILEGSISQNGQNLVVLALVDGKIHVRIFDRKGARVKDLSEEQFAPGQDDVVKFFRGYLDPVQDERSLSEETKRIIIEEAEAIRGVPTGLFKEIEDTRTILQSHGHKYVWEKLRLDFLEREAKGHGVWLDRERMSFEDIREEVLKIRETGEKGLPSNEEYKVESPK